jgi:hypothetical protein
MMVFILVLCDTGSIICFVFCARADQAVDGKLNVIHTRRIHFPIQILRY